MNNERGQIPGICLEVGLSCKRCTEDSATSLAAVCKGLRTKAVTQLFFQIYPESACAQMSSHFAKAYRAASRESLPSFECEEMIGTNSPGTRKEVGSVRPRTMAAVA